MLCVGLFFFFFKTKRKIIPEDLPGPNQPQMGKSAALLMARFLCVTLLKTSAVVAVWEPLSPS